MRYILLILAVAAFILVAGAAPQTASAATATPTLRSIQPTATSLYLYLRGTPTPLSLVPIPFNPAISDTDKTADFAINTYRALNSHGLVDFVAFIFVLGSLLLYLVRMIVSATREH